VAISPCWSSDVSTVDTRVPFSPIEVTHPEALTVPDVMVMAESGIWYCLPGLVLSLMNVTGDAPMTGMRFSPVFLDFDPIETARRRAIHPWIEMR
jgi:hypothetical protein